MTTASTLKPVLVRQTLQDSVYAHLRECLMTGQFAPGNCLTIRDTAALMGTSPMPVREAFRRLTSEGALEPLSNGKTRVPVLDTARLQELTEIRMVVEGLAARRAAERATPQEISAINRVNGEMLEAVARRDAAAEAKANEQFHFAVYRAAQSSELLRIIEHLWLRAGPFMKTFLDDYYRSASTHKFRTTRHHEELIAALRRRDLDGAEQALREDLAQGAAFIALRAAQSELSPRHPGTKRGVRSSRKRRHARRARS